MIEVRTTRLPASPKKGRADAGWDGIRAVFEDASFAGAPLRGAYRREEFVDFKLEVIALS
jgi:hypothetical protein